MSSQGHARERLLKALLEKKGIVRQGGGIAKADRSGPLGLSFAQQRLWFLEKLVPFGATYNIFGAVLIDGKVSFDTLERSLRALVARHESLRTGFVEGGGEPRQVISDQVEFSVGRHDLSKSAEAGAGEKLVALARELARKPFDLTRPPLLRVAEVEMPGEKQALLICMHHIVSDGWSMGVFIGELSALYEADGVDTLPPLPIQYPDFAEWQRGWLESEQVKSSLSFWRDNLEGAPSLLELPTDRPRPTVQTYSGATYFTTTDQALVRRVDQTARDLSATPFMVLFACFATLLHRYTGADDLVVGSPIAGRNKPETEPLIGFFVNALPIRISAAGDPSFESLVARTKEGVIAALEHQDVPFERIVEEVRPERDMGHPPLFQVTFALQNAPMPDLKLGSAEIGYLPVDTGATKFDLSLDIELDEGAFSCAFNYNTDMFDPGTIEQMAGHFENLLKAATSSPGTPVSALEILDAAEANSIATMYANTEAEYPRDETLHEQFEAVARQYPDRVAVSDQGLNTTYGDLDRKSQELALRIRAAGAEAGSPVGIFLGRGEPMIVSIVAVMKSGCACLPLDVTYPNERLSFMVQDSGARVIVTAKKHAGKVPDVVTLVLVDDAGAEQPAPAQQPLTPNVRATDPAYVMFTSGSTGVPKGILIPHRAVTSRVINANYAKVSEGEVMAQVANASFDVAIWEVWAALLNAGRLAIIPKEVVLDPGQFKKSLMEESVAYLFLTSTLFNQTVSEDPSIFETLDTVILGGEVADPGSVSKVLSAAPPKRVINIYGPTECTTYATYHVVTEVPEERGIPIGLPISNATVFILDQNLNLVPRGVTGEICLGGDGVAIGYMNRPELTKEKFVETPFGRLYRTGDLGRINSEGLLEFVARVDEQLKIRGVRIEPAEVESAITSHEGVDKAVVLGIKDRHGEKMLAAYYAGSNPPSPADLKTLLTKKLPPLFIPQALMPLDRIPLTPNGKADKRALPEVEISGKGEATPPASEIEKKIARIFENLLGAVSPGLEDDFFDLGGHSLLATRLVSHIAADAGAQIPLKAVFEDSTVGGLAGRTEAALKGGRVAGGNPIVPVERSDVVDASFAQQRLWFFDQFEPASSVYNVPMILRLKGFLDLDALRRSLREVMRRHEILRTTFEAKGGRAVQVIAKEMPVNLQVVDLSGVDRSLVEGEAERAATDEAQRPFDLARGPLLRTTVIKLSERDHLVVFATHHIVSDGWSLGILVGELSSTYDAFRRGLPSPLPEPHLQHADYSLWQKNWLEDLEQQAPLIEFWREYMHGATEVLEIPGDKPRPPVQTFDGDTVSFTIDAPTTDRIKKFCAERNITMFMALLAVFKVLLSRYSGVSDVVVATPIAGRTRAEMEGLIGFFVNTLVLRTDLSGNPTVDVLMDRVREASLGAFAHQEFPFEKLVEEVKPPRELAHSPVFQVVFSLQNVFVPPKKFGDIDVSLGDADTETAKFDLTLDFMETGGALDGSLNFNTNIFERQTAERMTGHYMTLLDAALSSPNEPVDRLQMMTPEEERHVKSLYLTERKSFQDQTTISSRFFRWVRETPNAVALKHGDQRITYSALSAMAEGLAGALHEKGVGPESVVPILCERGPEIVAGMLAVLRCGGAYAPLDPSYPLERLQFIVSDTRSQVIVAGAGMDSLAAQIADGRSVISAGERGLRRAPEVISPSNLAYVIYTSGSTGTPKGVGVTHHNITRLFDSTEELFGFNSSDVWSLFHSFSFDFSVWELWGALTTGGTAVIVSQDAQRDPKQFLELLESERVTVLNQTPSAFYRLSEAEERAAEDADLALRLVIFGGEALDFFRLGSWIRRRGDREPELFNMYGITETTVHVSHRRVTESDVKVKSSLIGRPLRDLQMLILDRQGELCPIGVAGEIHVAGDGIARGYLNRPALTGDKFVASEFAAGERLYRSGDLGRMTRDGDVQYLGRGDDQLKIRGFRIEPGEIAAALRNHPDVENAHITAKQDEPGNPRLVAYVTGAGASGADLRAFLTGKIPDYMVPSAFVPIEEIPLTPNGKVDVDALPEPGTERPELPRGYAEPRTQMEQKLAEIWQSVLKIDQVGIYDNFFDLGGDSFTALEVIHHAVEAGIPLSVRMLFQAQVIADLSVYTEPAIEMDAEQGAVSGNVVLTAQQRWFFEQEWAEPHHFNQQILLEVTRRVEPRIVEDAVVRVVGHHDALRSRFERSDDSWRQRTVPVDDVDARRSFVSVDLSTEPTASVEQKMFGRAADEHASLDLAQGPLFKAVMFDLGDNGQRILLTAHQLVVDGLSWGLIIEDLEDFCSQLEEAGRVESPPKTTSFRAWAARLADYSSTAAVRKEEAAWRAVLEMEGDAPADHPDAPDLYENEKTFVVPLTSEASERLTSGTGGRDPGEIILLGFGEAFAAWAGSKGVLVELEGHGRHDLFEGVDLSATVGWFSNTFPVYVESSAKARAEALAKLSTQIAGVASGGIAYGLLRYMPETGRPLSDLPQPKVFFSFYGRIDPGEVASRFKPVPTELGDPISRKNFREYQLEVGVVTTDSGIELHLTYGSQVYKEKTIKDLGEATRDAVSKIIDEI